MTITIDIVNVPIVTVIVKAVGIIIEVMMIEETEENKIKEKEDIKKKEEQEDEKEENYMKKKSKDIKKEKYSF